MNERTARRLHLKVTPLQQNEQTHLFSANGSNILLSGKAEVTLFLKGVIATQTVLISPNLQHNFLLGTDFLSSTQANICYQNGILSLFDDLVRFPLHSRFDSINCVKLARTVCIPAMTEALLPVTSPPIYNNQSVLLESSAYAPLAKVAVAKALAFCQNNRTVCRILNFSPHVVTLKKGLKLAKIENMDSIASIQEFTETTELPTDTNTNDKTQKLSKAELEAFHADYGFKICPTLSEDERLQILELLHKHKPVFARDMSEIKAYTGQPMTIDLHSQRKCFKRQYPLSKEDQEEADRQIREMKKNGILEDSQNPFYNSPIFLVNKKNNQKRLVVDLRELNKLIVPKLVQLPHIDELIQDVTQDNPHFMSTFDLTSAFWSIPIAEQCRDYLSITGVDGQRLRFARCPFGMSTSPAGLLLAIGQLFSDRHRYQGIRVYMDDIVAFGRSFGDHLRQIDLVLDTLGKANLSVNPNKTEIGYQEIEYLGYRISGTSIRLSERHIKAISNMAAPKNLKALQRCLGATNFFRKHIPNYAKNTYHMRQLLKKDVKFQWSKACQNELDYLKTCLTSDPILRPMNPNKMIYVCTDASQHGYGWVTLQKHENGQFYATSYGAKATTKAQTNYASDDLELIALMYALRSIETVALHRPITVITDNTHVLHFHKWKPINKRQKRMIAYLMMFNLHVVFTKGSRNLMPDALSRLYQDSTEIERQHHQPTEMHDRDDFILSVMTRSKTRAALDEATKIETARADGQGQNDEIIYDRQATDVAVDGSHIIPDPQQTSDVEQNIMTGSDDDTDDLITLPQICAQDYDCDQEFQHIYKYLVTGELSGESKIDKVTLLMSDRFVLENGILYRTDYPRRKRMARVKPILRRLCVPIRFRHELIKSAHENLGHYATQSLFLTLSTRYYWRSLFSDINQFCKTCGQCQKVKIKASNRHVPLHEVEPASGPGERIAIDHKILTRKTAAGSVAILVAVDVFSGYVHLIPVPDVSAATTAKMLVKFVIPTYGIMKEIQSDKASAFTSALFTHINKILGIKHVTSAALTPRSNGLAESMVKRLVEHLKFYCEDDYQIEEKLPLVEMALRATSHSKLEISPHEIIFGKPMRLGLPGDPETTPPEIPKDQVCYYRWLSTEIRRLHEAVKKSRCEAKVEDKSYYDRRYKAKPASYAVGDLVLMEDKKIRPGSAKVVTKERFIGPLVVKQIVRNPPMGTAYQLVNQQGKTLKNLVSSDRLKAYNVDREQFTKRLPRLIEDKRNAIQKVSLARSNMIQAETKTKTE